MKRREISCIRAWVALAAISPLALPLPAATLTGTLQTTTHKLLRASVTIHDLSTPRTTGQTAFDRRFASLPDGTFSLTGVPPGKYEFCVESPQENVLDPCLWTPGGAPSFTIPEGAAAFPIALTVETGYMLRVRVNDPDSLLPASKSGVSGDLLLLQVMTQSPGPYSRALNLNLLASTPGGRDHYLIVPWERPLMLVARSSSLALVDEHNVRIPNDLHRIPLIVRAGSTLPIITLGVGRR